MARASFFVLLVACGGGHRTTAVEIAQPLPTVPPSEVAAVPRADVPREPQPATEEHPERDPRRLGASSMAVLRQQAPLVERLVAATAQSDPDRPQLLLRLAEIYVRLRRAGDAGASARAIRAYDELTRTFPSFKQIDRAYFGLAMEYEAKADWAQARRAYFDLIKNAPQSTYVPYAYYAFAELFASEAKADPSKWSLAQQVYAKVLQFPSSPIVPYAICRMSQTLDAQGKTADAAKMRTTLARSYPGSEAARQCGGP
jgi:tetratricopeptide (TPR) repeat protein